MKKAILTIALFLISAMPISAQGIIYLPMVLKEPTMPDTTVGLVVPYGGILNYVINPSGEIDGGYSAYGGGSVSRSSDYQKYGLYSYLLDLNASGEGVNWDLETTGGVTHFVTARVRVNTVTAKWSFVMNGIARSPILLETIDNYWKLYGVAFPDTNGLTALRIQQTSGGVVDMYVDGLQVEVTPESMVGVSYTTYMDGTQPGCKWLGAPHASASYRSNDTKAGGIVKDLFQGYGFFLKRVIGAGVVTPQLNIDNYALLPGGEVNSEKIPPRQFTLVGEFYGNDEADLHAKQQALELALGSESYPENQPNLLRFYKATVQKEIKATYSGGLEGDLPVYYNDLQPGDASWTMTYKFLMPASIQFTATDPFFYEVGESAAVLDTIGSATFRIVAGRLLTSTDWSNLGPPGAAGTYTVVNAIVEDDTYIYFGGDFLNFDGIAAADRIVRYHKQTRVYSALDVGLASGSVRSIAIAPNGDVYIAGTFLNAGGLADADYITRWDGTQFNAVGVPNTGTASITIVEVLKFDLEGNLYIGGDFDNWANIANADGIVKWDGSAYSAVGTGTTASVNDIGVYSDNTLLIGGNFTTFNGTSVNHIVKWDGTTATALGDGTDALVNAILIVPGDIAYIGGAFSTADGVSSRLIVSYNGSAFLPLGSGLGGGTNIQALAYANGILYVGGNFTSAGGIVLSDRVSKWNGYTWSHLDINLPGTPNVSAIHASNIDVDPVIPRNYALYLGYSTTGTGEYAGVDGIENEGSFPSFPKIIFNRSGGTGATVISVRNERTGRELLLDYDLVDEETLTIDLYPKNRKIVSSFFGERPDAVLPNSDLSIWQLLPGENQVSSYVSESGSPTITGYLLWRDTYKSWN